MTEHFKLELIENNAAVREEDVVIVIPPHKHTCIPEHEKDLEALWTSFGRIPNNKQDNTQYTERGV